MAASPTATILIDDADSLIGRAPTTVTITFTEAVTGVALDGFTYSNGVLSNLQTGDNMVYTATFIPNPGIEEPTNVIGFDMSTVQNLGLEVGAGSPTSSNFAIDTVAPTASSIVVAEDGLAIGDTSLVTITFSEAVTGLITTDLSVANGTLSTVSSADGGKTWTATLTADAAITDTDNVITLDGADFTDLAGNAGSGTTTSDNYEIDTVRPTVSITVDNAAVEAGDTPTVTITFSEAVNNFTDDDLKTEHGTFEDLVDTGGDGRVWTATFLPDANITDTTNVITLDGADFTDLAGNAGAGLKNSANFTIDTFDTIAPTVTSIVIDNAAVEAGDRPTVTITFSEAVNNFTADDLKTEHGTFTDPVDFMDGRVWTATFLPDANITDTTNVITLDGADFIDVAGNTGSGLRNSANFTIDTVAGPGPSPEPEPNTPTAGDDVITLPATGGTISAGEGADSVAGGGGDDIINGNTGDDSVSAGAGDDIARGGQGSDFVHGNTGDDQIFGDIGDDTAAGGQGGDFVQGNAGNDKIFGDLGNDTMLGGQGDDVVTGGAGDDYVSGDLGNDILTGGTGADLFNFSGGSGKDMVVDFSRAEGDQIRISPSDAANFSALSSHITSQGADTVITLGAQTVVLVGVSASSLTAADFVFS